jgi:hypothetical protein
MLEPGGIRQYIKFNIEISSYSKDTYQIRVEFSDPDDIKTNLAVTDRVHAGYLQVLFEYSRGQDIGKGLAEWLFESEKIRNVFSEAYGRQTPEKGLRVQISLPKALATPEKPLTEEDILLLQIPWETLAKPGEEGKMLATDSYVAFSRNVESQNRSLVGRPSRKDDLRILVFIAAPPFGDEAFGEVDVEKERSVVTRALKNLDVSNQIDFIVTKGTERTSMDVLIEKLGEGYDFVYLVCHGELEKGEAHLVLEDNDGRASPERIHSLIARVEQLKEKAPRLVAMTACESGGKGSQLADSNAVLAAIGLRLVQAGIPAVIAMQGKVGMDTTAEFMEVFFREILQDGCIDRAVAYARQTIHAAKHHDWWMPVLFMNLRDGLLWEPEGNRGDPCDRQMSTPSAPPMGNEIFVGRGQLLSELKRQILEKKENRERFVFVLLRMPGIGKTELALHLAHDPELLRAFLGGILWVQIGQNPKIKDLFKNWLYALGDLPQCVSQLDTVEAQQIRLKRLIGSKQMLLLLDDVWDYQNASYFLDINDYCIFVLTTRLQDVVEDLKANANYSTQVIRSLSEHESQELFCQFAPQVLKAFPQKAKRLIKAMNGHPYGLKLAGQYLSTSSEEGNLELLELELKQLTRALKTLSDEEQQPLAELSRIIKFSEEHLDEETRQVFRKISIFLPKMNSFSTEEAAYVCGIEEEDEEDGADEEWEDDEGNDESEAIEESAKSKLLISLDRLKDVGLLEYVPNIKSYTIHSIISDYAQSQLSKEERRNLHKRAADYYQAAFRGHEENKTGDYSAYMRMYDYENPEWQRLKTNWLYHLSFVNPEEANRRFAIIFMDAFWWWGCYRDFPFCNQLLNVWEEHRSGKKDRETLSLLRRFQQVYPLGYEKQGKGDWGLVEKELLDLRKVFRLDGVLPELGATRATELDDQEPIDSVEDISARKHFRAITNIFLAESRRYRNKWDLKADEYYEEALNIFCEGASEDDDDAWNVPWVLWHQGDLYLERGQGEDALRKVSQSRELALKASDDPSNWDNEVIANDYRVEADVYWQRSQRDLAWSHYAMALLFAYEFQANPKPADFYTIDFYGEMTTRILVRLKELWVRGEKEAALQGCDNLYSFWMPYWKDLNLEIDAEAVRAGWESGYWDELEPYIKQVEGPAVRSTVKDPSQEERLSEEERSSQVLYLFPPKPSKWEVDAAKDISEPDTTPDYFGRVQRVFEQMYLKTENGSLTDDGNEDVPGTASAVDDRG